MQQKTVAFSSNSVGQVDNLVQTQSYESRITINASDTKLNGIDSIVNESSTQYIAAKDEGTQHCFDQRSLDLNSSFNYEQNNRQTQLKETAQVGQLDKQVRPNAFYTWAKNKGLEIQKLQNLNDGPFLIQKTKKQQAPNFSMFQGNRIALQFEQNKVTDKVPVSSSKSVRIKTQPVETQKTNNSRVKTQQSQRNQTPIQRSPCIDYRLNQNLMLQRVTQLNSNFFFSTNSDLSISLNQHHKHRGTSRSRNQTKYQTFDPLQKQFHSHFATQKNNFATCFENKQGISHKLKSLTHQFTKPENIKMVNGRKIDIMLGSTLNQLEKPELKLKLEMIRQQKSLENNQEKRKNQTLIIKLQQQTQKSGNCLISSNSQLASGATSEREKLNSMWQQQF